MVNVYTTLRPRFMQLPCTRDLAGRPSFLAKRCVRQSYHSRHQRLAEGS